MNTTLKIKVCGMREVTNIQALLQLPIDYLGMIFYPKSKRYIQQRLMVELPATIQRVGVFVNSSIEEVLNKKERFALTTLQLHGQETPTYCTNLKTPETTLIKVFHVDEYFDFEQTQAYAKSCDYFLFDTKGQQLGGNGYRFNWLQLKNYQGTTPFFLSGGIGVEHAQELKTFKHPQFYGIDINSRFEIRPALKNIPLIHQFLNQLL